MDSLSGHELSCSGLTRRYWHAGLPANPAVVRSPGPPRPRSFAPVLICLWSAGGAGERDGSARGGRGPRGRSQDSGSIVSILESPQFVRGCFGGAVASCLVALGVWLTSLSACSPELSRRQLSEAWHGSRPVEGRLTGGLAWEPYAPDTRLPARALASLRRTSRRLESRSDPRALGDLAFVRLLSGRTEEAVVLLERATAAAPGDAALSSDLAAAYIARGHAADRPYDFVRALTAADRALALEPGLPEALFNRALALDELTLEAGARGAWGTAADRETDASWRAEERHRQRESQQPGVSGIWNTERDRLMAAASRGETATVAAIVGRFPQPARLLVEEHLLTLWAGQEGAGRAGEAERTLSLARAIGEALLRHGDAMAHDAVAAIGTARADRTGVRLRRLVEGHRAYGVGLSFYRAQARDLGRAEVAFASAERHLRRGGSPLAGWAGTYLASIEYFHSRLTPARVRLLGLERGLPAGRYPSLAGRIALVLGSIEVLRGRPGDALPRVVAARAELVRSGEGEDLSFLFQHLARIYRTLGEPEEAWKYLHQGLRLAARLQSARQLAAILDEAGLACQVSENPGAALYFQNETLALGTKLGDSALTAAARRGRALTLLRLRRTAEARREIAAALRLAAGIPDQRLRGRIESDILSTRAEISMVEDSRAAARDLTTAIEYYELAGYRLYMPVAHFLRARAFLAGGDPRRAESDFRAGLAELEGTRSSVLDPQLRIALYDQAAALFEETLTFLVRRGNGAEAFQVSEQGRARQLLESLAVASLSRRPATPGQDLLSIGEIRRDLPSGTVLVKYTLTEDSLLLWAFSRERESFRQVDIRRAELETLAARARSDLLAGRIHRSNASLRKLYEWLIEPAEDVVSGAGEVVFVPDGALSLLPFSALISPGGRYLVEDRAVLVAPSANVYARCLRRSRGGWHPPRSALVLGASEFDRRRFPALSPLASVPGEAEAVAAQYADSRLLLGPRATRGRFEDEIRARQPEMIHFAGHAVLNPSFPELSQLLFAPDPEKSDPGAVYSHEIHRLQLSQVRLVVLSACDAAVGKVSASEGAMGLARPFLAAGVPTVLASLGAVDDQESREILISFHRHLLAGDTPAQALRAVQRARLAAGHAGARPGHWARFEIIGANPPTF